MKNSYYVMVKEVHYRYYEVSADNEEEAKILVKNRHDDGHLVKDIGQLEFSHEEDSCDWIIEETRSSFLRRKSSG